MEIVTVWVRYKGDEWDDAPQLVEAWTEYDIDNNEGGWIEARDKAINNSDIRDHRIVNLLVPYSKITDAFADADVDVEGVTAERS